MEFMAIYQSTFDQLMQTYLVGELVPYADYRTKQEGIASVGNAESLSQ